MTIALKSVDIENNMATYLHRDSLSSTKIQEPKENILLKISAQKT